jgi:3-oxoacyl-[acyl-carrier-protein] synthase II
MSKSDIAITGIGILSPFGIGAEETVAALREGGKAVFETDRFTISDDRNPIIGEVPDFNLIDYLKTPKSYLDRNSELFLAACGMAIQNAAIDPAAFPEGAAGLLGGTAWSGVDTMSAFFGDYVTKGPRLVKPVLFPHTYANTAISLAAMEWQLTGPHLQFSTGRIAAAQAIAEGVQLLREEAATMILAGGSEALGASLYQLLDTAGMLAKSDDGTAPAPLGDNASGTVPAEAGVVLCMEGLETAQKRQAMILAKISGVGLGNKSAEAISAALSDAGLTTTDLSLVCLSANGFGKLDQLEAGALQSLPSLSKVPVFAPIALCGDTSGVCSALHLGLIVLAMNNEISLPVTIASDNRYGFVDGSLANLADGAVLILTTDLSGASVAIIVKR